MASIYHPAFADHLEHPRNIGELPDATVTVELQNPACGDRLRLSLLVDNGVITEARIKAYGCPQTLASASAMSELIVQRHIDEAQEIDRYRISEAVGGLPRHKMHAAALAHEVLQTALRQLAGSSNP